MGTDDLQKIERCLQRCEEYLARLREFPDQDEAILLWENFLSSWCKSQKLTAKFCRLVNKGGIADQIKSGVSGGCAEAQYLLHARNADEHTFEAVVISEPERRVISLHNPIISGEFIENSAITARNIFFSDGQKVRRMPDFQINSASFSGEVELPAGATLTIKPSYVFPLSVKDRNGVTFEPPHSTCAPELKAYELGLAAFKWVNGLFEQCKDELGLT